MLLILKYSIFDQIIQEQVLDYDRSKKCPKILYGVNLWLKLSDTLGLLSSAKCRYRLWLIAKFQMRHRLLHGLQRAGLISSKIICLLRFVYCMNYMHHIATFLPPPLYGTAWVH